MPNSFVTTKKLVRRTSSAISMQKVTRRAAKTRTGYLKGGTRGIWAGRGPDNWGERITSPRIDNRWTRKEVLPWVDFSMSKCLLFVREHSVACLTLMDNNYTFQGSKFKTLFRTVKGVFIFGTTTSTEGFSCLWPCQRGTSWAGIFWTGLQSHHERYGGSYGFEGTV